MAIIMITTLLLIRFVTTAVYCVCKNCSNMLDNQYLDYHYVSDAITIYCFKFTA